MAYLALRKTHFLSAFLLTDVPDALPLDNADGLSRVHQPG